MAYSIAVCAFHLGIAVAIVWTHALTYIASSLSAHPLLIGRAMASAPAVMFYERRGRWQTQLIREEVQDHVVLTFAVVLPVERMSVTAPVAPAAAVPAAGAFFAGLGGGSGAAGEGGAAGSDGAADDRGGVAGRSGGGGGACGGEGGSAADGGDASGAPALQHAAPPPPSPVFSFLPPAWAMEEDAGPNPSAPTSSEEHTEEDEYWDAGPAPSGGLAPVALAAAGPASGALSAGLGGDSGAAGGGGADGSGGGADGSGGVVACCGGADGAGAAAPRRRWRSGEIITASRVEPAPPTGEDGNGSASRRRR